MYFINVRKASKRAFTYLGSVCTPYSSIGANFLSSGRLLAAGPTLLNPRDLVLSSRESCRSPCAASHEWPVHQ
ncbi:hypothetical protein BDV23DRAFT_153723 [Aspergillus alliaceus]|uniref:Uncharacterized protein n=1 Tax=Petromyces alliaceus TaxID=209559 RepID=A0A5N7CAC7_PETAA|nr:hypothetical protein BDV23DRAFT_153723 [Aspergillus alliaceus]